MVRDALKGLRIAAYARFSDENQRDSSIDAQFKLLRDHVERQGGTLAHALADRAISGTRSSRDGYDRLLALVESKSIDIIVAESQDRLSRDVGDADRLWKLCKFHDVRIVCVSDGIDSASRGSRLQYGIKSLISDEYIEDLRSKTLRGLRQVFADKKGSTGALPYGLTSKPIWTGGREPDYYEPCIDPEKAPVVVRIFDLYVAGNSYLAIASTLNREGIATPRAGSKGSAPKMWRTRTIASMIQNATYIGEFTFGNREWRKDPTTDKRRYIKRDASEVQTDHRPELAIVSRETFERANARRKVVASKGASGKRTAHPFSGLLYCFVCGSKMIHVGGSPRHYYACNRHHSARTCDNAALVRDDLLIDAAFAELTKALLNENLWSDLQKNIERGIKRRAGSMGGEQARVEKALASADVEVNRLVRFIASTDDKDAVEAVRAELTKATARRKELQAELAALQTALTAPRVPTHDEVRALATDLHRRMRKDPTGFRELLRSRYLNEGKIVMEPRPDGSYVGHAEILTLEVARAARRKARTPETEVPGVQGSSLVSGSCGGPIWTPTSEPAFAVPFPMDFRDRARAAFEASRQRFNWTETAPSGCPSICSARLAGMSMA